MNQYQKKLRDKMDAYVHLVHDLSSKLPSEELYGVTSQWRRASLSVVLNYIEGYARHLTKSRRNFLRISYGSLKESKYLLFFCYKREWLSEEEYSDALRMNEEIGAML